MGEVSGSIPDSSIFNFYYFQTYITVLPNARAYTIGAPRGRCNPSYIPPDRTFPFHLAHVLVFSQGRAQGSLLNCSLIFIEILLGPKGFDLDFL